MNEEDKAGNSITMKEEDKKRVNKRDVKKEPKKKKNMSGPLHITVNEPVAIGVIGDLDPNIFNQVRFNFLYVNL